METRVVHFYSEGNRLEGEMLVPSGLAPGTRRPGIVLCHGFTGIREIILPEYARVFTEAGYVSLFFDYRGFGGSEGPKWRLIPLEQIDDIRNAITFLQAQPEVDAQRVGVWGTSFGGGHAPYVAGVDGRVKVAVGQVGFGDGERLVNDVRSFGERAELADVLDRDRVQRVLEGKGQRVDSLELLLRDPQSRAFIPDAIKAYPNLRCELSWETLEKTAEYKPIEVVDRIAPRALLLVGAERDTICPIEGYRKLYERAREPKKLVVLPITHYEIYSGQWFEESSRAARQWFDRFLM